jgi:tetratricopeptide (TPR) repeat protein
MLSSSIKYKGQTFTNSNLFEESIRYYKTAIMISPDYSDTYVLLGRNYRSIRMSKEALRYFKKAVKYNPSDIDNHLDCGHAYGRVGKNDKAIAKYNEALLMDNKNLIAINNLGVISHKLGQFEDAINYFDQYISIDEKDPTIYFNKALALCALHQYEEAQTFLMISQEVLQDSYIRATYYVQKDYFSQLVEKTNDLMSQISSLNNEIINLNENNSDKELLNQLLSLFVKEMNDKILQEIKYPHSIGKLMYMIVELNDKLYNIAEELTNAKLKLI